MRCILKELQRHYWRTIFSIAGYAVATIFILIILCVTVSYKNDSFGILKSTGTHFIVYIPTEETCCSSPTGGGYIFAEGVKTRMLENDMIRTVKNIQGIRDAAPCLLYKIYDEGFLSEISISGIDTTSIATRSNVCARTNVISGKFLSDNPYDLVAEQSFAAAHGLSVGDTIRVFGSRFTLAGIVNSGIKPVKADFYAPLEYVRSILRDKLQCNSPGYDMNIILVEVEDARLQDEVIAKIKNLMYRFSVSTYNCYEPAYQVMSILDNSSLGLTIVIFLFLVIFSAKTQLSALAERFREIGILKSLGWKDEDLGIHILVISCIHAISGVTAGIILGAAIIQILNASEITILPDHVLKFQYSVIPLLYCLALLGAFIAGLFPAARIFRKRAGEIMKEYL